MHTHGEMPLINGWMRYEYKYVNCSCDGRLACQSARHHAVVLDHQTTMHHGWCNGCGLPGRRFGLGPGDHPCRDGAAAVWRPDDTTAQAPFHTLGILAYYCVFDYYRHAHTRIIHPYP